MECLIEGRHFEKAEVHSFIASYLYGLILGFIFLNGGGEKNSYQTGQASAYMKIA